MSLQKSFHTFKEENLQFKISAFNFLNHPLHSFTSNFQNEYQVNLTNASGTAFNQGSVDPSLGFGYAPYTTGRRVVELMAKYTF